MKRLFDFTVALAGIILLFPVILVTGLLVRIKLGAPVLFKQERPGLNGVPFTLYKFRTMTDERDERGEELPDEMRLTPFGSFLRKYSLDELPQLWNVVKGDMSLIGPRPLKIEYLPLYSPFQARRHEVKPGITGWAQVNGRNATTWERRFELDVWYVDNRSFILDMKILWLTLKKAVRPEGIHQDGHVTMPEFTGSAQLERKEGEL